MKRDIEDATSISAEDLGKLTKEAAAEAPHLELESCGVSLKLISRPWCRYSY